MNILVDRCSVTRVYCDKIAGSMITQFHRKVAQWLDCLLRKFEDEIRRYPSLEGSVNLEWSGFRDAISRKCSRYSLGCDRKSYKDFQLVQKSTTLIYIERSQRVYGHC